MEKETTGFGRNCELEETLDKGKSKLDKFKRISVVTKEGRIISIHDAIKSDESCSISKEWTVLGCNDPLMMKNK
jgi:hypothetical protein